MKEELVTFETAKLAKEVGFDIPCGQFYDILEEGCEPLGEPIDNIVLQQYRSFMLYEIVITDYNNRYDNLGNKIISHTCASAPTQSLLQRWLREKHNIHIRIYRNEDGLDKYTFNFDNPYKRSLNWYDTYEKALEAGLLQALKLIKK